MTAKGPINASKQPGPRRVPWGDGKRSRKASSRPPLSALLFPSSPRNGQELSAATPIEPTGSKAEVAPPVAITCCDYCPERIDSNTITDLRAFLDQHRPEWCQVRWINVEGLTDPIAVQALADKYKLDPLAIEDLQRVGHRPRSEDFPAAGEAPGRLFVIARMIRVVGKYLHDEQLTCFLGRHTLITFQEARSDFFEPVRQRLRTAGSRLRRGDGSLLLHALLDCIVEHLFPILEDFSDRLERLERSVVTNPKPQTMQRIHRARRELLLLRRSTWPMRDLISQLQIDRRECLSESAQVYFRDVYSHVIHVMDLLETQREFLAGLSETYFSAVSNRMNEIVKTLTIISTIFVPLTFLAGVYGMNMPIPENQSAWAYPIFWLTCLTATGSMLYWFRRRGWF